jgi:hypothetical protein
MGTYLSLLQKQFGLSLIHLPVPACYDPVIRAAIQ